MSYTINRQGFPAYPKVNTSRLDYSFDWSEWLTALDDEISTYEIDCSARLTLVSDSRDGAIVTVLLDDGIVGYSYPVTCSIVTVDGREDSRTIYIDIIAAR